MFPSYITLVSVVQGFIVSCQYSICMLLKPFLVVVFLIKLERFISLVFSLDSITEYGLSSSI